ncbi:MAG: hypothetical protein FWD11_11800, partial [Micrococcales bacterium]|nr:hypothetical protein [Micrococcales bacterium]
MTTNRTRLDPATAPEPPRHDGPPELDATNARSAEAHQVGGGARCVTGAQGGRAERVGVGGCAVDQPLSLQPGAKTSPIPVIRSPDITTA